MMKYDNLVIRVPFSARTSAVIEALGSNINSAAWPLHFCSDCFGLLFRASYRVRFRVESRSRSCRVFYSPRDLKMEKGAGWLIAVSVPVMNVKRLVLADIGVQYWTLHVDLNGLSPRGKSDAHLMFRDIWPLGMKGRLAIPHRTARAKPMPFVIPKGLSHDPRDTVVAFGHPYCSFGAGLRNIFKFKILGQQLQYLKSLSSFEPS